MSTSFITVLAVILVIIVLAWLLYKAGFRVQELLVKRSGQTCQPSRSSYFKQFMEAYLCLCAR